MTEYFLHMISLKNKFILRSYKLLSKITYYHKIYCKINNNNNKINKMIR